MSRDVTFCDFSINRDNMARRNNGKYFVQDQSCYRRIGLNNILKIHIEKLSIKLEVEKMKTEEVDAS